MNAGRVSGMGRSEQGIPVRRFTSRKGQRHLSGLCWSATTNGLHVFERIFTSIAAYYAHAAGNEFRGAESAVHSVFSRHLALAQRRGADEHGVAVELDAGGLPDGVYIAAHDMRMLSSKRSRQPWPGAG